MDNSVGIRLAVDAGDGKKALVDFADTGDAQAKRLARSYDQAADDMIAADRRRAQAAEKINAVMPQTAVQQIYQAGASTNTDAKSARDSAAAFKELLAAQEDMEARAASLKAKLDPLHDAQAKYDAEIKNARELLAANLISETDHERAVSDSTRALNAAKKELGDHSSALSLNRQQFIIGQSAVMRFTDSIIAGQSPFRAAALEAHKLGEVLSVDDNGVAGGLAKVRAIATPTNLLIGAGAIAMTIAAASAISYGDSVAKLTALSQGAGRVFGATGAQLEASAEAAASAGHLTVSAARDIEAGYLGVAKSGDVLTGLTAITKDFAAATGVDAKAAQQQLAAAFADPIQGAADLAEKYGLLTQAQTDHIGKLIEEGRQEQAQQEMLRLIQQGFGGAAEKAEGLAASWEHIKTAADKAWVSAGRFFNTYGPSIINGGLTAFGLPDINDLTGASSEKSASSRTQIDARANQARARAAALSDSFRGDNTDALQRTIGTLRAGIQAGGTAEQIAEWTTALSANQRALDTWVPQQQKANDVSAASARVAAARTPAEKAAAATALVMAQNQGVVITKADLLAQAHDRASAASARASNAGAKHAETLAREAASMDVSASEALKVAAAYSTSTAAGIEAEARRKAATDATKKGIDVEAQARRQLNLETAEAIAAAGKTVANLNDETAARTAVLGQVQDGTLSVEGMSRALSDEAALRPLLIRRTIAHGDALDALNKKIAGYRDGLVAAHKVEDGMAFEKGMQESRTRVSDYEGQTADLDKTPLLQALGTTQRATSTELQGMSSLTTDQRSSYQRQKADETSAKYAADRARYIDDTNKGQADSISLAEKEASLAAASEAVRASELDQFRLQLEIRRRFPDMAAEDVQHLLAGVAAVDAANVKAQALADTWSEIRSAGDQFLSDLTSPDGSGLKRLLGDIEQEFIKLAALNPLKNLLLGEKNPTLGGVLGSLLGGASKLFPGSSTSGLTGVSDPGSLVGHIDVLGAAAPRNASGTEYFSGGQTWLAENGPELVTLPTGSKVTPAPATRRLIANDNAGGDVHQHFYLDGAIVDQSLYQKMVAIGDNAAARGAAGGAQLAQAAAAKRARYRIPGR